MMTGTVTERKNPWMCMRRPIENNSSPGQAVYDPFSGRARPLSQPEMTGRSCFAIEIDPAYVDVTVLRWQAFTGEDARLDQDRRSFTRSSRRAGRRGRVLMGRRAHKPVARFGRAQRRQPFGLPARRGAMCGRLIDAPWPFPPSIIARLSRPPWRFTGPSYRE